MSVRDFANHPCPVCKSDTLHVAMVCQSCNHVQVHPHEQFESRCPETMPAPKKRNVSGLRARGRCGK